MKNRVLSSINQLESLVANVSLSIRPEKSCLITLLFHGLFKDRHEIEKGHVLPGQQVTISDFERTIAFFKSSGYQFVTPSEVAGGLDANGRYLLLTFDDGYFNNHLALPIMEEYEVPAVFYISPYYISEHISFWWDVVYREAKSRSLSIGAIDAKIEKLKLKHYNELENVLIDEFGGECFRPWSDIDRPFRESELKDFSKHPLVTIGNHTYHHSVMTEYTCEENEREIRMAQDWFECSLGLTPDSFSFPNGNVPDEYGSMLEKYSFSTGIGLESSKNKLNSLNLLCLNRSIVWGDQRIRNQGVRMRAGFHFIERLLSWKHRLQKASKGHE